MRPEVTTLVAISPAPGSEALSSTSGVFSLVDSMIHVFGSIDPNVHSPRVNFIVAFFPPQFRRGHWLNTYLSVWCALEIELKHFAKASTFPKSGRFRCCCASSRLHGEGNGGRDSTRQAISLTFAPRSPADVALITHIGRVQRKASIPELLCSAGPSEI